MHNTSKGQGQGLRRPRYLKSNSHSSSPSSSNTLASLLLQGPLRRLVKRRTSLISLFPRSNTTPADYSSSSLRCFAKLHIPPSPLFGRPSLQTQLVELHCPSIQQHRSRDTHSIYIQSASCSSTDIEDDGQGGYGGESPHEQLPRIAISLPSTDEAVQSTNMALTSSSVRTPPALDPAKSNSLTATASSTSRMSLASGFHDVAAASRTSLGDLSNYSSSYPGESSNVILGSNGVLSPRSSILRNPSNKKTFVDAWRPKDGSGPAVLQIQARQTIRDREAEKEKDRLAREKEIERELKEMEQAEKVWGIPKKAFYMGLGEINFNAQMAILGGWGNGSGPATDFRPNMPSLAPRRVSNGKVKTKREREREKEKRQAIERAEERRKQKEKEKEDEGDSEDSIDAEELAALNAIINTRRSMDAAQILASRNNRIVAVKKSTSQDNLQGTTSDLRPNPVEHRQKSDESVQTAVRSSSERVAGMDSRSSSRPRPRQTRTSSEVHQRQNRIRFAPLPQAYNTIPMPSPSPGVYVGQESPLEAMLRESSTIPKESPGEGPEDQGSDTSELDEPEEEDDGRDRSVSGHNGSKSRWYLMGMPKSVFRPQTYRSLRRPSSAMGVESALSGELGTSPGVERSSMDRRGRRASRLRRSASLAGSIKSRSSSVGSIDDEERMRRRQLIRASRPGGTGMVTLPDGTRIRARRVGDQDSEEEDFNEWGFAGLSRRRSVEDSETLAGQVKSGDKRASDEERADEEMDASSGMAWVKRRRRAREESKSSQRESKSEEVTEAKATSELEKSDLPVPIKKTSDGVDQAASTKPKQPAGLNALQAAEVRRRHEEEVAALGAEVLESIAKHKRGKQHPARSATWDAGQPAPVAEKTSMATQTTLTNVVEQRPRPRGRPRRTVSMFTEEEEEQPSRPSALANIRSEDTSRSSSQPSGKSEMSPRSTVPSSPIMIDLRGEDTPTGFETPKKGLSRVSSQVISPRLAQIVARDQSPQSNTRIPGVDASTTTDAAQFLPRSLSPGSPASQRGSIPAQSPTRQTLSPSSSYRTSTPHRRFSSGSLVPVPSPTIPRKPDGRGYAVVPLPNSELGRRPERPREGRVWQFDDDDDDSDDGVIRQNDGGEESSSEEAEDESEVESDGEGGVKKKKEDEDDDEDEENTMNDEELAEEERRTAIQKKRATTRAAGAEMVSSLAKPNVSKAPRSPKATKKSAEFVKEVSSPSTAAIKPIAIPKQKQSKKVEADVEEGSDISDDLDLWPPTLSGTQLSRTLSGGESAMSELEAGKRASSSSNRNVKGAISLAAHSAKARVVRDRKSKEKKENEKLRAIKRKEERDLDYGWPKSLNGSSLYN